MIAFPIEGFTWPIWYNTKVFKAAGVEIPKTTDESDRCCQEAFAPPVTVAPLSQAVLMIWVDMFSNSSFSLR